MQRAIVQLIMLLILQALLLHIRTMHDTLLL